MENDLQVDDPVGLVTETAVLFMSCEGADGTLAACLAVWSIPCLSGLVADILNWGATPPSPWKSTKSNQPGKLKLSGKLLDRLSTSMRSGGLRGRLINGIWQFSHGGGSMY